MKITHGCRAQSLHIAAVGGKVEVSLKDIFLAVVPLQLQSQQHLAQLGPQLARF